MRIFVLGDSYSDNLFKKSLIDLASPEIKKFVLSIENENIEKAKWWTDWLEEWGHEVHNVAIGGSTIESLIYQFGKIDQNFKAGDRLILNITHPSRFNWYNEDGSCYFIHNLVDHVSDKKIKQLFQEQAVNRETSFIKDYLKYELVPFLDYLINKHSEYKPIVWSTFKDSVDELKFNKYFFNYTQITSIRNDHDVNQHFINNKKYHNRTQINQETRDFALDRHFGRYGNYELAILFNEVLNSDIDGHYLDNEILKEKLIDIVMNNNKVFEEPKEWKIRKNII